MIFSGATSENLDRWTRGGALDETWVPISEIFADLERRPGELLAASTQPGAEALSNLDLGTYKLQCAGVLIGGERLILANFFCREPWGVDWRREIVVVENRGSRLFQVDLMVGKGRFENLTLDHPVSHDWARDEHSSRSGVGGRVGRAIRRAKAAASAELLTALARASIVASRPDEPRRCG